MTQVIEEPSVYDVWAQTGAALRDATWMADGACVGHPAADIFFPMQGEQQAGRKEAEAICATCPVRVECADWATRTMEPHGIWGGLGPPQRAKGVGRNRLAPRVIRKRCLECDKPMASRLLDHCIEHDPDVKRKRWRESRSASAKRLRDRMAAA